MAEMRRPRENRHHVPVLLYDVLPGARLEDWPADAKAFRQVPRPRLVLHVLPP